MAVVEGDGAGLVTAGDLNDDGPHLVYLDLASGVGWGMPDRLPRLDWRGGELVDVAELIDTYHPAMIARVFEKSTRAE